MSSYRKGRRFEYEVRDFLKEKGWLVLRCAGSKPFDLVALKKGLPPLLIECKADAKLRLDQIRRQEKLASRVGAAYLVIKKEKGWRRKLVRKLAEKL
ncbi:MAG: hypothetical protein QXJ59_04505 [Thermofilaceae archaeon]